VPPVGPHAPRRQLSALTSLRFFAALWVVVFHFLDRPLIAAGAPWPLLAITGFGDVAVPFFFVLSGYVLAYTYTEAELRGHVRDFYVARMARTYPAYLLALVLFVGLVVLEGKATFPDPLGLVLTVVGVQAWLPSRSIVWNYPAWSLSVEFFLYAVFPLMLALLRRPRAFWTLYGVTTAAILALAIAHALDGAADYEWIRVPLFHLTSFATGMALARARPRTMTLLEGRRAGALTIVAAGALLAVTLARQAFGLQGWWPLFDTVALVPVFASLIVGAAHLGPSLLDRPAVTALGEASYALYILQLPVALVAVGALSAFGRAPILWPFVGILVLVGASLVTHRYFERPTRQWIRRALTKPRAA
jgi:peptidoglycan/LPS O-acetylase OafA/YrhL